MKSTSLKIGDVSTAVTNIVYFKGNLIVFKTDGVYQVYGGPEYISEDEIPRVVTLTLFPVPDAHCGKYAVVVDGFVFYNYRNQLVKLEI